MVRSIKFYRNYFIEFYLYCDKKVQEKIEYVFQLLRTIDRIPEKFLKHAEGTDGIYEIRVKFQHNQIRVLCCFDNDGVLVLLNAFQKKSKSAPKSELEKGIKLKGEYFQMKIRGQG